MKYILALDQGTTSSRAILFDRSGSIEAQAQAEFPQYYPHPGWVEHDPNEIWKSQLKVARLVLRKAGVNVDQVGTIGITNQRETTIIWDRNSGEPIAPAIVWQDRRTSKMCDELIADGLSGLIQKKTGLIIDAYFSATKIQWLLKNVKGARARAKRGELAFGTVDSWLIWKLTGGKRHVTDVSNAARTMLFNIHQMRWDDKLLELFGIPKSMLPEVASSSELVGETNLVGGTIPIAGIAGDQQAALFGQTCFRPGMAKNTYGTGCFLVMNTGKKPVRSRHKLLTTVGWRIGNDVTYVLEGGVFVAGAVTQWLRDGLGLIKKASDIEPLAQSVSDNGGVFFVPAFAGLGAPHWDQDARGLMTGLTRGTTSGNIARAALEGIAFQVADVVEAMEADTGSKLKQLRVDGGACVNDLLMQFQADVLGRSVVRPKIVENTARGAAYLAGLAVGFWKSRGELEKQWEIESTFKPSISKRKRESLTGGWQDALRRTKS